VHLTDPTSIAVHRVVVDRDVQRQSKRKRSPGTVNARHMGDRTYTQFRDEETGNPWQRLLEALQNEFVDVHPRLHLYNLAQSLLPVRASGELRAHMLRLAGFNIGVGTRIDGPLRINGPRGLVRRLSVGSDCSLDADCVLDLSDTLTIGNDVTIEPGVLLLTGTHELGSPNHRASAVISRPVTIGDGAWLRCRAVVLPGVTIGAGAIVDAGAVVDKDVEPHTRVGGVPAVKLETPGGDKMSLDVPASALSAPLLRR